MNKALIDNVSEDVVTGNYQNEGGSNNIQKKITYIRSTRFIETNLSTISKFICDDSELAGYFLEPSGPSTAKANIDKRIPVGTYNLEWHSGSFKNVPLISNNEVSKKRAVLIHNGNGPKDTEGCLLVGSEYSKDFVGNSVKKLQQLRKLLTDKGIQNVKLIIDEAF